MKNTMKKILCTLLAVLLCVTITPFNLKADASYVLTDGVCRCEDHDDHNPCRCCLWCDNLDRSYVLDCAKYKDGNWTVCCEICNGLFSCVCECSCCTPSIEVEDHFYKTYRTTEPTCEESGTIVYRCSICDQDLIKDIPALGHIDLDGDFLCDRENCKELVDESGPFTEGMYTYTINGDDSAIIKQVDKSISGDVVIPSTLGGYPVTAIGDDAFAYCCYITNVTVPEGVTSIGENSFEFNLKLEKIYLPDSLVSIGDMAFAADVSLKEISIPENIKLIDSYAFIECLSLEKIIIKGSEAEINEYFYAVTVKPYGVTKEEWIDIFFRYITTDEVSSKEFDAITKYVESEEDVIYYATIYGYDPSTAKTYAEENGIQFKNISELDNEQNERTTVKDTETNVEIEFDSSAFETEVSLVVSEDEVNANIAFGDEYENYKAFDISIEANGEKVQPKGYVTVKLPIPADFNAETTVVYYVDENGNKTKLESTTENGYIIFETDHFSEYVLVDESTKHEHSYKGTVTKEPTCTEPGVKTFTCSCNDSYTEPVAATGHSHKAVTTAPTCTEKGYTTYTCSCGDSYVADYVNALGHKDDNGDSKCDNGCGYEYEKPAEPEVPSDPSENCSCNCHKGGFMGFIWKIINFFQKIFKANPVCTCGAAHY